MVLGVVAGSCAHAVAGTRLHLRTNTAHGLEHARGAVTDSGLLLDRDIQVSASSSFDGRPFLSPEKFIADAEAAGATILSSSFSGWHYPFDSLLYTSMVRKGMVHVYAYEPRQQQPQGVPPPAVFVTVNMVGGKSGPGIEFGVPKQSLGGGKAATPSAITAHLAGLMAVIKYRHPDWNWFDVKAALRATASNFAAGYNDQQYGYGTIDFVAADSLHTAARLPLFPPAALMRRRGTQVTFLVNSFQQTRRSSDALFRFRSPPRPVYREVTLPEIVAGGGQLLFAGDLAKTSNALTLQLQQEESAYYVWFSKGIDGLYSRIEPYSIIGPLSFSPEPLRYGPRLQPGN
jgi:hypothetical protein